MFYVLGHYFKIALNWKRFDMLMGTSIMPLLDKWMDFHEYCASTNLMTPRSWTFIPKFLMHLTYKERALILEPSAVTSREHCNTS